MTEAEAQALAALTALAEQRPTRDRRLALKRLRMWLEDPICCYCGEPTVLVTPIKWSPQWKRWTKNHAGPIDNMATTEHVYSRLHPDRLRKKGEHLIACWRCNLQRSRQEHKATPIEELHRRSQNHTQRRRKRWVARCVDGQWQVVDKGFSSRVVYEAADQDDADRHIDRLFIDWYRQREEVAAKYRAAPASFSAAP